jgi:hypothetical protein
MSEPFTEVSDQIGRTLNTSRPFLFCRLYPISPGQVNANPSSNFPIPLPESHFGIIRLVRRVLRIEPEPQVTVWATSFSFFVLVIVANRQNRTAPQTDQRVKVHGAIP